MAKEKTDFMEIGDIFQYKGQLYECSGITHDNNTVYGYLIRSIDESEYKVKFYDVEYIYEKREPIL